MAMTGARYLAESLQAYGVTHVFFVPTMLTATLVAMERHTSIQRVLTHGEKTAAYMADGYARATGRPGICFAQAIGTSNLAAGLRDAWLARSPVIAFTGTSKPGLQNRTVYQQVDDRDHFRSITKWSARIDEITDLPHVLRHAFRIATSGSPGPVHIEIAGHFGELETLEGDFSVASGERFGQVPPYRPRAEAGAAAEALQLLAAAERPVIVAGGGARNSGAGTAVVALAERLRIPIATAMNAKALLPGDHPLNVGVVGLYSRKSANLTIVEADLVFFIGSGTGSQVTFNWKVPSPRTRVIQLDLEATEIGRHYPDTYPLIGDARTVLEEMIELSDAAPAKAKREAWIQRISALRGEWFDSAGPLLRSEAVPIRPERVCAELTRYLPDDTCLIVDTGHSGMWAAAYIDLNRRGQTFVRSAGSLGWGLPGAIGAAMACPDKPALLLTGDGGFWYHLSELETAVRWQTKLVVLINNNQALSQEKDIYTEAYGGELTGRHGELWFFQDVDFAALAEKMGALGLRVERPSDLQAALKRAFECSGPCVIDVRTERDAMAPMAVASA